MLNSNSFSCVHDKVTPGATTNSHLPLDLAVVRMAFFQMNFSTGDKYTTKLWVTTCLFRCTITMFEWAFYLCKSVGFTNIRWIVNTTIWRSTKKGMAGTDVESNWTYCKFAMSCLVLVFLISFQCF